MSVAQSKRKTVHNRDAGKCHYCHIEVSLTEGTVDHVWPKVMGGPDGNWNLVWSCKDCNHRLGSTVPKCACSFCAEALSRYVTPPLTYTLAEVLGVLLEQQDPSEPREGERT